MYNKARRNERGISLIEVILVLVIGGLIVSAIVPRGIEAVGKSNSTALQEEFASVVTAFTTLDTGNGSATHAVKATITDEKGNLIMKDYIIPVAPSAAFGTITKSEVFRRNATKKPIELTYTFNNITLSSELKYKADYLHTGDLIAKPAKIDGPGVVAVSLSAQGAAGIAPIFSVNDSKMLEDFIMSPTGLDFSEYRALMGNGQSTTDEKVNVSILATLFGGPETNTEVKYYPYEPSESTGIITRQPIQLTVVDVESIKSSSSGATYKTITDSSKGTLYQVTGLMSRADFVKLVKAKPAVFGTADADLLYDKISVGFTMGTPVFVPHREKDIIKSSISDLKYGYYRP